MRAHETDGLLLKDKIAKAVALGYRIENRSQIKVFRGLYQPNGSKIVRRCPITNKILNIHTWQDAFRHNLIPGI